MNKKTSKRTQSGKTGQKVTFGFKEDRLGICPQLGGRATDGAQKWEAGSRRLEGKKKSFIPEIGYKATFGFLGGRATDGAQ